jgi:hypothetical protein
LRDLKGHHQAYRHTLCGNLRRKEAEEMFVEIMSQASPDVIKELNRQKKIK